MPGKSLEWIKDIEIGDLVEGDIKLIYDNCGMDVLISLWANLPSMGLYISAKPLAEAKKRYIKKHHNGENTKELCRFLDVSERFVYDVLEESNPRLNQERLFNLP